MSPLCYRCRQGGMIKRHRHCAWCGLIIWGSDQVYISHAWNCTGPQ
jgi:hypothetical protein